MPAWVFHHPRIKIYLFTLLPTRPGPLSWALALGRHSLFFLLLNHLDSSWLLLQSWKDLLQLSVWLPWSPGSPSTCPLNRMVGPESSKPSDSESTCIHHLVAARVGTSGLLTNFLLSCIQDRGVTKDYCSRPEWAPANQAQMGFSELDEC